MLQQVMIRKKKTNKRTIMCVEDSVRLICDYDFILFNKIKELNQIKIYLLKM